MMPSSQCFEVVAVPKGGDGKEYVLRRFKNHQAAAKHALEANMEHWDDIWVRKSARPMRPSKKQLDGPPPTPWSVAWVGTHTYLVDASGNRLASLVGPVVQRELVARMIIAAMQVEEDSEESHANGRTAEPTAVGAAG